MGVNDVEQTDLHGCSQLIGKLFGRSGIETTARYSHLAHDSSHNEARADREKLAVNRPFSHLDRSNPPPVGTSRYGRLRNTRSCQPFLSENRRTFRISLVLSEKCIILWT